MSESRRSYEFGPYRLQVDRRLLLRDGVLVALAPKALETLLALIEHRGRVLTKDELLQRVWGDTVVEEGGLARNISVLRKALGETPDDHQFIVTVPGRGYRFVAEVVDVADAANDKPAVEAPAPVGVNDPGPVTANAVAEPRRRRWPWRSVALAGLAALAAGALVYGLRVSQAVDAGRPPISALAVLPLDNLSGDPSQEYFADGTTEALIANLARIRALRVVSRTSVMRFKGATRSLPDIARTLNVDAVVEGSVQRSGDRVRINVQLVHAPTDTHLWARTYERELTEARKILRTGRTSKTDWLASAAAYAALDDKDEAFRMLFRMFEGRDGLNYVKTDPRLDSLHADPRWQVLLRRMNLLTDADSSTASR